MQERPKYGILDGRRVDLTSEEFKSLPIKDKARVVVDFGYGPVRPYRPLLEPLEDQL